MTVDPPRRPSTRSFAAIPAGMDADSIALRDALVVDFERRLRDTHGLDLPADLVGSISRKLATSAVTVVRARGWRRTL